MQDRNGKALSGRERRALAEIEQDLSRDGQLERALRTVQRPRTRWLRWKRSPENVGAPGGEAVDSPAADLGRVEDREGNFKHRKQSRE